MIRATTRATLTILLFGSLVSAADFKEFKRTVPMEGNGRFSLDTYKGSIRISAWDQPQVDIQARIVADPSGWFPEPVEDVEIRVDSSAGSVRVKTEYRREHWSLVEGNSPSVNYTIRVPRHASLSIKDYKSETDISEVQGAVEFDTYKGTARLAGLRGGLDLKTYKGDIRASFASFSARSHVDTYKGAIDLTMPRASAFEMHAELERHASLDCDFPRTLRSDRGQRDRHQEMRSTVNGGGPELRITSYRGSIRVRAS
jgi:hypothetical protein